MVISFEKGKKKREKEELQRLRNNFHSATENLIEDDSEENFNALLDSMADRIGYIISRPEADEIMKREEEAKKRFYERYKDIFKVIPISGVARLQHLASAMLNLIPTIFHEEWETRFDTYADFGHFHLDEFDPICSKLEKKYGKPDYPFQFNPMSADALEIAMNDCLNKIIDLCSKDDDESNITEILYSSARLFELDELLTDLFGEEIKAREKNEEGT